MFKTLLLVLLLVGCHEPVSTQLSTTPKSLSFESINNFTRDNNYFNNIINLRDDCFNTHSPSGLLGKNLFIGIIDHTTVGYFGYFKKNSTTIFIHDVCIASSYRGKGIGTELFKFGLSQLEAMPFVTTLELDVHTDNENAIKLYKKAGFNIVKTFSESHQELYLMRKELSRL